jgi:hypothetical protein
MSFFLFLLTSLLNGTYKPKAEERKSPNTARATEVNKSEAIPVAGRGGL